MAMGDPSAAEPSAKVRLMEAARRGRAANLPRPQFRRRLSSVWYSRFVGVLRIVLPVIAVGLVALVLVWPYLEPQDNRFRIGYSRLTLSEGGDPSAVNPRFLGTDKKNQIYSITADVAKNLVQDAAKVELEMPKADITLQDGSWLVITADTGVYTRNAEDVELNGNVTVYHDGGYEFQTSSAQVDLGHGVISGFEPITGQGPFGHVSAEGFQVIDMGEGSFTIYFTGKSKVTLFPNVGPDIQ